jgi:hypothetical protein
MYSFATECAVYQELQRSSVTATWDQSQPTNTCNVSRIRPSSASPPPSADATALKQRWDVCSTVGWAWPRICVPGWVHVDLLCLVAGYGEANRLAQLGLDPVANVRHLPVANPYIDGQRVVRVRRGDFGSGGCRTCRGWPAAGPRTPTGLHSSPRGGRRSARTDRPAAADWSPFRCRFSGGRR